jgi:hypothetical protein
MFECWDENKVLVKSYLIKELPKEIIEKKKFTCPCCEENISFIKEYYKPKGLWRAHFSHKPNSECSGYTPAGESQEHYTKKMILLDDLHNKEIEIQTNGLKWNFDKSLVDYIVEEKYEIDSRRADIIVRLKKPNVILGNGIAIEIVHSESETSINNKRDDYAKELYSLATLNEKGEVEIVKTYPEVLSNFFKKEFVDYKNQIELYEQKAKLLKQPFVEKALKNNWTCLNCRQASIGKTSGFIACWREKNKGLTTHPREIADFTPCDEYSPSNKPDLVIEDYEMNKCVHSEEGDLE